MAAKAILRSNKTSIVDTLVADYRLILNKAEQKELITRREYNNLKSINKVDDESHVVALVDKIMNKGEETCQAFLKLLQTDEDIQATYPELKNILKKGNLLPHPVQASSVGDTDNQPQRREEMASNFQDGRHFQDVVQLPRWPSFPIRIVALKELETKWRTVLSSILDELTEVEFKKLLLNLEEIPQGKKERRLPGDMIHLIIQYYGTEGSIPLIDRQMKILPRLDNKVQQLLRVMKDELKKFQEQNQGSPDEDDMK